MQNFRRWILKKLNVLGIVHKKTLFSKLWVWIMFVSIILISIIFQLIIWNNLDFRIFFFENKYLSNIAQLLATAIILESFFIVIIFMIGNKLKVDELEDLDNVLTGSLDGIYEVYANEVSIKDKRFKLIKVINKNNMLLEVNGDKIKWNISEKVNFRKKSIADSAILGFDVETPIYVLNYKMLIESKKLIDVPLIQIKKQNKSIIKGNPLISEDEFSSESIEFNRLIDAKSADRISLTKIFSPKIMDNFIKKGSNSLKGNLLLLENGEAWVNAVGLESASSYRAEFYDFNGFKFNVLNKICDSIVKKIENDFDLILKTYDLFSPLELN